MNETNSKEKRNLKLQHKNVRVQCKLNQKEILLHKRNNNAAEDMENQNPSALLTSM